MAELKEALDAVEEYVEAVKINATLQLRKNILAELKAIKASFVDINTIENHLKKLQAAEYQLGALFVIDKVLDVINKF